MAPPHLHLRLGWAVLGLQLLSLTATAGKSPWFVENLQIPATPGLTYDEWAQEAKANLTHWRNNLFQRTMLITRYMHEARVRGLPLRPQPPFSLRRSLRGFASGAESAEHPRSQGMFQLSNPFIQCPPPGKVTKVGGKIGTFAAGTGEDGQKYLCNVDQLKQGCSVLSIGSRSETSFEEAILAATPCEVYTLDCTLKKPLQTLSERHKFLPLCLGSQKQSEVNPAFVTLPQLMQKIGKERVDILKMDIEGYEWDVLASLGTESGSEASLPTQMAIEFHVVAGGIYRNSPSHMKKDDFNNLLWPLHSPTFSQFQLLQLHLVDLGYGITSRDDNPLAGSCTEMVFHRVPM